MEEYIDIKTVLGIVQLGLIIKLVQSLINQNGNNRNNNNNSAGN